MISEAQITDRQLIEEVRKLTNILDIKSPEHKLEGELMDFGEGIGKGVIIGCLVSLGQVLHYVVDTNKEPVSSQNYEFKRSDIVLVPPTTPIRLLSEEAPTRWPD